MKLIDELPQDFVSVSQPFFNESGCIVLVSEDDKSEFPALIQYDINKILADPKNTLISEDTF